MPEPQPRLWEEPTWSEAMEVFLRTLDSPRTARAYRRHLQAAGLAIPRELLRELLASDLVEFRSHVTSSRLSSSTKAQALSAVRSFMTWGRTMGLHTLSTDVIEMALRTPRVSARSRYAILTEAEITRILDAAPCVRDRALLGVLLGSGLRVSEAAALDVSHLTEDEWGDLTIFVRQGKGRKDREVPIRGDVGDMVREYLAESGRFLTDDGPLFLATDRAARSRSSRRLSARSLESIVTGRARAAHISAKRVTPHALRHTFAIRTLRNGGDIMAVMKLLGHASVATTQRYLEHQQLAELRGSVPHLPVQGGSS